MKPIGVALLGAGRMGQIHWRNVQSLQNVRVSRVYDPELARARDNVDDHLSKLLTDDLTAVLDDSTIQACVIATPSTFHAELIALCAQAGKHVFCEKPVSFDISCLTHLKELINNSSVHFQIGFNRRFDPSFRHIQQQVNAGAVGDVQIIKITNRDPKRPRLDFVKNSGGLFFDFNVHDFDMLKFITNDEIESVYAAGDTLIQPELKMYNDMDTAIISVKMKGGALAIIDASRETGYGYDQQIEVFGSRGMLHMKNQRPTSVIAHQAQGSCRERIHETFVERYRESYQIQLSEFFTSIHANTKPTPTIDDAIHAIKAAHAAQRSRELNQPVALCA